MAEELRTEIILPTAPKGLGPEFDSYFLQIDEVLKQLASNKSYLSGVALQEFSTDGAGFKDEDDLASDSPTAAASQQSIKAYIDGQVSAAWATWTPVVTQDNVVAHTATVARWVQIGKIAIVNCTLEMDAAGTITNVIVVSGLPVAIVNGIICMGAGSIVDTGALHYSCSVSVSTATAVIFISDAVGTPVGVTPNFALADGDFISFTIVYEVA